MSTTRRRMLFVAAGVVVYYLIILFTWALQPLEDAVPIGRDEQGKLVSQTVQCNTLFDSAAHSGPLPVVDEPNAYERPPCVLVHDDARKLFVFNTLVVVIVAGGLTFFALRQRGATPERQPQPSIA